MKWVGDEVKYWVVSPGEAIKVLLTTSDIMWKSDSELRENEQPGLCDNPHLDIFLHVGRELIDVADGKIVMFLGKWDWASDQIELTDDNEYLTTFEKNPWDVR